VEHSDAPATQARLSLRDEIAQGFVVLMASGAALQVLAHPRQAPVRVLAGELEVNILVEQLEALLATDLGTARPQQPRDQFSVSVVRAHALAPVWP
jgi:hypothetical protein